MKLITNNTSKFKHLDFVNNFDHMIKFENYIVKLLKTLVANKKLIKKYFLKTHKINKTYSVCIVSQNYITRDTVFTYTINDKFT